MYMDFKAFRTLPIKQWDNLEKTVLPSDNCTHTCVCLFLYNIFKTSLKEIILTVTKACSKKLFPTWTTPGCIFSQFILYFVMLLAMFSEVYQIYLGKTGGFCPNWVHFPPKGKLQVQRRIYQNVCKKVRRFWNCRVTCELIYEKRQQLLFSLKIKLPFCQAVSLALDLFQITST